MSMMGERKISFYSFFLGWISSGIIVNWSAILSYQRWHLQQGPVFANIAAIVAVAQFLSSAFAVTTIRNSDWNHHRFWLSIYIICYIVEMILVVIKISAHFSVLLIVSESILTASMIICMALHACDPLSLKGARCQWIVVLHIGVIFLIAALYEIVLVHKNNL